MTSKDIVKIKNKRTDYAVTLAVFFFAVLLSAVLSPNISEYARAGLELCFGAVIGSVFPFMILTDLISKTARFENIGILRRLFELTFKINGYAITAFIVGALCGFPLGVRVAARLYEDGYITKDECERLIGFSNNSSPAFVIAGVGSAMRDSVTDGVILYLSMILSAIITGAIFGIGAESSRGIPKKKEVGYNLADSVRGAAEGTVNICGFVVFFSVVCGLLSLVVKNAVVYTLLLPFIEVSNAAKLLAASSAFGHRLSLSITAFTLSFSGLSVHLQAKSMLVGCDISMRRYYLMKLLQGGLGAIIAAVFVLI